MLLSDENLDGVEGVRVREGEEGEGEVRVQERYFSSISSAVQSVRSK